MNIRLENINLIYPLKTVLSHVSIEFKTGYIHAIVGQNGAGKSTLADIITGYKQPTTGKLFLNEKEAVFHSHIDAVKKGIQIVHQRPLIAEGITVKENILMGLEHSKKINLKVINHIKESWAPDLKLDAKVSDIGADGKFYTALISTIAKNPEVLILDEPSAALDWQQRRLLYANMRNMVKQGVSILIITHSLQEASLFTDTVTVLKEGKLAAFYSDSKQFVKGTEGYQDFQIHIPEKTKKENTEDLSVINSNTNQMMSFHDLSIRPSSRPSLFNIDFSLHSHSITLIRGLPEAGLETLEDVVTGMEQCPYTGSFEIITESQTKKNIDLSKHPLKTSYLRGNNYRTAGIIPSKKNFRGSNPNITVLELLTTYYRGKKPEVYAEYLIEKAKVCITPLELVSNLSGGMLQKLIMAREIDNNPKFLIISEPLQGLDTDSAATLCKNLYDLSQKGTGILILSATEFPQEYCSSFYKLEAGKLKNIFKNNKTCSKAAQNTENSQLFTEKTYTSHIKKIKQHMKFNSLHGFTAVITGILAAVIILLLLAPNKANAVKLFITGIFSSSYYFGIFFTTAMIYLTAGLGAAISIKSGHYNLGGEGQIYAGGFAAALFLNTFKFLPGPVGILGAFIAAAFTGGFLTFISAILKQLKGAAVLLTTFLVSAAVIPILNALIAGPFRDTAGNLLATPAIATKFRFGQILPPSPLNFSFIFVLLLSIITWYIIKKTRCGRKLCIMGTAPEFSRYSGYSETKITYSALLVSGALHGIAGFLAVCGTYYKCHSGFYSGMGWNAFSTALIANAEPLLVIPSSLLLSWLYTSSSDVSLMQNFGFDIGTLIQGIVLFFISAKVIFGNLSNIKQFLQKIQGKGKLV